jgi:dTDP-glucose 4,6-dehydratase
MRVIITGGAGFLGSHLCDLFVDRGDDVVCIDNLCTGDTKNIAHLKGNPNFEYIQANVTEFIKVNGDVDAVLHFASPASPVDYLKMPIQTLKVGALGTHNALGLAKAKKARFLLASTSEVYGDPLVHPQPETYWGNVNCVGPRGVYDEAKRYAEALTMAYHRVHKMDTKIVRIFNTYGPRVRKDDGRAIPNFISQALAGKPLTVYGDGSQSRSFCYVSDMVDGIYKLLMLEENEPVNIGNPKEVTILELAKIVLKLSKSKSEMVYKPLPVDDPKVRQPDISKAKRVLGWKPKVSLDEGLRKTLDWFKE